MTASSEKTPQSTYDGRHFRIAEGRPGDAARSVVRLPRSAMRGMGLRPGDTVRLAGRGVCFARVLPAAGTTDAAVQIDPAFRAPLGRQLGEEVEVSAMSIPPANTVSVASQIPGRQPSAAFDRPAGQRRRCSLRSGRARD